MCKECCNLTVYKLKEFADDNLEYNENGRKFSKWVENRGKGGTAPEFMFTSIIVPWVGSLYSIDKIKVICCSDMTEMMMKVA